MKAKPSCARENQPEQLYPLEEWFIFFGELVNSCSLYTMIGYISFKFSKNRFNLNTIFVTGIGRKMKSASYQGISQVKTVVNPAMLTSSN